MPFIDTADLLPDRQREGKVVKRISFAVIDSLIEKYKTNKPFQDMLLLFKEKKI
ncbi:MAG: hypothetical protein U9N34_10705 [Candidatus Cloacimonadota bacterium]|nr:hypothetical protein [Candidatus Cloacimonadota bacterium]